MLVVYHYRKFEPWPTERTGCAKGALNSETSGQTISEVVEVKRDADVGKVVHKDGV
ncbi:hypothetical protein HK405_010283 [Cladochytrium tenue]|nr:hypothetical protein HK405_010283 [Cladochytrium tenue]